MDDKLINKLINTVDLHTLESPLAVLSYWFSLNSIAWNPYWMPSLSALVNATVLHLASHINVAGSTVPLSETVKLLGITFDKSLTFHKQVFLASLAVLLQPQEGSSPYQALSWRSNGLTHCSCFYQFLITPSFSLVHPTICHE